MTSGEIIALILERGRMSDESFLEEVVPNLIELTSILSKDSQKHRAKKERKAQRASFRDVLRYLEVRNVFFEYIFLFDFTSVLFFCFYAF